MKTLILTGWGWKDYACAAALALRHYKVADVYGISKRRLPEFLDEVKGYRQIVILGVGLGDNPALLGKALERLAAKKTEVSWISVLPLPKALGKGVRDFLKVVEVPDAEDLTDAVSRTYGIPAGDLASILQEKKSAKADEGFRVLLDAAMYIRQAIEEQAE